MAQINNLERIGVINKTYYAHSGNNPDKSDWQLLPDHLKKVSSIAAESARYFDATKLAETAGLLHDIGKYTEGFAKRLEGGKRVDHATAGAKIAIKNGIVWVSYLRT